MLWPFSFTGQIRRATYAIWSIAVVFSQYLLVWSIFRIFRQTAKMDWLFYISPLQTLFRLHQPSGAVFVLALVHLVIAAWILTALAFRRAANAGVTGWVAAFVIAPTLQIPLILFLCLVPPMSDVALSAAEA